MIIRDLDGCRYNLTKTKLRAIDTLARVKFTVFFDDIRANAGRSAQLFSVNESSGELHGKDYWIRVEIDKDKNTIGCKRFSLETFSQIMKAAGVK